MGAALDMGQISWNVFNVWIVLMVWNAVEKLLMRVKYFGMGSHFCFDIEGDENRCRKYILP